MTKVAVRDAKEQLDRLIDDAIASHRPVAIERADGQRAVLVSQADYDGLVETAQLLSSAANASRLLTAIGEAESGRLGEHDLAP